MLSDLVCYSNSKLNLLWKKILIVETDIYIYLGLSIFGHI